jgi:hypothetical protein
MGETIYNVLPDVCGVLLAAVGIALVIAPDWVSKVKPATRWVMAGLLLILGLAGLTSSYVQHRQDGIEKAGLHDDIKGLQATVSTFGPKLDEIIKYPNSPEQKALALVLQREMDPKVEISEPNNQVSADGNTFQWTLINTGRGVAKDKTNQVIAVIRPDGKAQDEAIFANFYQHENDPQSQKRKLICLLGTSIVYWSIPTFSLPHRRSRQHISPARMLCILRFW